MEAVKYKHTTSSYGLTFSCRSGMLFITLPSGRNLAYVKPKVGTNKFGGECITYEGIGSTKKWERLDSYGPKFVENIVQATSRDILCYAMKTLRCCSIVMHIHDELVIEADPRMSLDVLCEQMGRTPPWAPGLQAPCRRLRHPFTKKIKNHPLKSGVHLQWEIRGGRLFYVRPERRTPALNRLSNSEGYP
jgi:DNA polymerase